MRATTWLVVLLAVALLVTSGLCAPGNDCLRSFAHGLFVMPPAPTFSFVPGVAEALRPALALRYDSVVADPIPPPPRA